MRLDVSTLRVDGVDIPQGATIKDGRNCSAVVTQLAARGRAATRVPHDVIRTIVRVSVARPAGRGKR
ncbi:hypothetical protein SAMN05661080_04391 [Modestobacter sp. DSM 44400]|nr:hypothetical protein SAMN05661080_04391 [Modestobacter sp. DSM 44400]